jgi:cytochrome c oxidase subunit 1
MEAVQTHHAYAAGENYLNTPKGLKSWLLTVDHKRIGIMYLWGILAAFFIAGILALLIRIEMLSPKQTIMSAETYNQVFTLHGAIMVFLFIIPSVPAALGNFVLPLMLGAKDVAFPRLNLLSYYIYVVGVIMALSAIILGGVDTGWTFYTPYSTTTGGAVGVMVLAGSHCFCSRWNAPSTSVSSTPNSVVIRFCSSTSSGSTRTRPFTS